MLLHIDVFNGLIDSNDWQPSNACVNIVHNDVVELSVNSIVFNLVHP